MAACFSSESLLASSLAALILLATALILAAIMAPLAALAAPPSTLDSEVRPAAAASVASSTLPSRLEPLPPALAPAGAGAEAVLAPLLLLGLGSLLLLGACLVSVAATACTLRGQRRASGARGRFMPKSAALEQLRSDRDRGQRWCWLGGRCGGPADRL